MTSACALTIKPSETANGFGFSEKLAEGESGEEFIASCLRRYGKVFRVDGRGFQKVGIDAFLISDRYGYTSLQFKRCSRARTSGNAFIETAILNDKKQKVDIGWAYKTTAQSIAYWAVGTGCIYLIDTMAIKRVLPDWCSRFRTATGKSVEGSRTWYGEGLCVPLPVIVMDVCTDVLTVKETIEE